MSAHAHLTTSGGDLRPDCACLSACANGRYVSERPLEVMRVVEGEVDSAHARVDIFPPGGGSTGGGGVYLTP